MKGRCFMSTGAPPIIFSFVSCIEHPVFSRRKPKYT